MVFVSCQKEAEFLANIITNLAKQIEELRQELQLMVKDDPKRLRTNEVYALSVKLDQLILKFNHIVQESRDNTD